MEKLTFPEGEKLFMGNLEAIKYIDLNNHIRSLSYPYFTKMRCTYINTLNNQTTTEDVWRHEAKGRFWLQALHYDWVACSVQRF